MYLSFSLFTFIITLLIILYSFFTNVPKKVTWLFYVANLLFVLSILFKQTDNILYYFWVGNSLFSYGNWVLCLLSFLMRYPCKGLVLEVTYCSKCVKTICVLRLVLIFLPMVSFLHFIFMAIGLYNHTPTLGFKNILIYYTPSTYYTKAFLFSFICANAITGWNFRKVNTFFSISCTISGFYYLILYFFYDGSNFLSPAHQWYVWENAVSIVKNIFYLIGIAYYVKHGGDDIVSDS
jgi:hypothetical protein